MLQRTHSPKEKAMVMFYLQSSPFNPLKIKTSPLITKPLFLSLAIENVHSILTAAAKRAHNSSRVLRVPHLLEGID